MPGAVRRTDTQSGICNLPCNQPNSPVSQNGENDKSTSEYSPDVSINNLRAVRLGDKGSTKCQCLNDYSITEGSGNVSINGKKAVRVGDATLCDICSGAGNIVSGSSNVSIN